jgi:acetyl-CoA carboxylase carboxyltransferase component
MTNREDLRDLGGGAARQAREHRLGKKLARERVAALVEPGSFAEIGGHDAGLVPGDGLVAGVGQIDGRTVALVAHDATVDRGSIGAVGARKWVRVLEIALERRLPVVTLADSDGARIAEGVAAVDGNGRMMHLHTQLARNVPQVTLVCGLCVGAAAYAAALGDFVGMVRRSWMFITGPGVTRVATAEDVTIDDLGGPEVHATKTGACHAVLPDEDAGLAWVRAALGYLTRQGQAIDPVDRPTPEIGDIVPESPRFGYDMRKVLRSAFDRDTVLELSPRWAPNALTAMARLGGRSVAIVASQPMHLAGCLDIDASRKIAAFVRKASTWGLPVITLVDVPGYLPGRRQEEGGILPFGAEVLQSYGDARTAQVCLVVRKSYGGGNVLSFPGRIRLALPTARVAPMGVDAAIEVALGPELDPPTEASRAEREQRRAEWLAANDTVAAAIDAGYLDRVIRTDSVRIELYRALEALDG